MGVYEYGPRSPVRVEGGLATLRKACRLKTTSQFRESPNFGRAPNAHDAEI